MTQVELPVSPSKAASTRTDRRDSAAATIPRCTERHWLQRLDSLPLAKMRSDS